jgi:hypothetical protein
MGHLIHSSTIASFPSKWSWHHDSLSVAIPAVKFLLVAAGEQEENGPQAVRPAARPKSSAGVTTVSQKGLFRTRNLASVPACREAKTGRSSSCSPAATRRNLTAGRTVSQKAIVWDGETAKLPKSLAWLLWGEERVKVHKPQDQPCSLSSKASARLYTFSTLNPNSRITTGPGAEAPKRSTAITSPRSPM